MCIICVDLEKDKLTWKEARRNLNEFSDTLDKEHKLEVLKKIWEKEDEEIIESYLFMYKKNV
tara:strand:- start:81 stop:266 length:186 start_codon:yes stop_codon:yes gene_type:complete